MSADLIATVATIRVATSDLIAALVAQGRDVGEAASLAYDLALDAADEARVSALAAPEPVADVEPEPAPAGESSGQGTDADLAPVDENAAPSSGVVQPDAGPQVSDATPVDDSTGTTAPVGQVDTGTPADLATDAGTNPADGDASAQVGDGEGTGTPDTETVTEPAESVDTNPPTGDVLATQHPQPNNAGGLPEYTYSGDPADLANATDWTKVGETADGEPLFTYARDSEGNPPTGDGLGGVWHLTWVPESATDAATEPVDVSGQPSA